MQRYMLSVICNCKCPNCTCGANMWVCECEWRTLAMYVHWLETVTGVHVWTVQCRESGCGMPQQVIPHIYSTLTRDPHVSYAGLLCKFRGIGRILTPQLCICKQRCRVHQVGYVYYFNVSLHVVVKVGLYYIILKKIRGEININWQYWEPQMGTIVGVNA